VPILMFTILFGLSMDYEVFLLARVREFWQTTGDAHTSVVRGLAEAAATRLPRRRASRNSWRTELRDLGNSGLGNEP
jgi:uncharacterized membrane protein YdfJ with MMPL/SSD domain